MRLVTRDDLGWADTASAYWPNADGVKVHYEGTAVHINSHDDCWREWRNIRASHLANTAENYSDIAYNFGACKHGYVFEGRGLRHKTGANGNQTLNGHHYSVVAFLGDSGDTEPTPEMLHAIRDAIEYMQRNGAGSEIKGHRDGYATSCPGQPLYNWVTAGAPRPEDDMTPDEIAGARIPYYGPEGKDPVYYGTMAEWLNGFTQTNTRMEQKLAAMSVAVQELAAALAKHNPDIDADALVAKIKAAIEEIDVKLVTS